jgi:hypothetical protein
MYKRHADEAAWRSQRAATSGDARDGDWLRSSFEGDGRGEEGDKTDPTKHVVK